jgi:hypothetical protein
MRALIAAFAWQPWAFLGMLIGLPIVIAQFLARRR